MKSLEDLFVCAYSQQNKKNQSKPVDIVVVEHLTPITIGMQRN